MSQPDPANPLPSDRDAGSARPGPVGPGVEVQVAGGVWVLRAVSDGDGGFQFDAQLTSRHGVRPLWAATAPDLATLEETIGWALPADVQHALNIEAGSGALPPAAAAGREQALPNDAVQTQAYRPSRASVVRIANDPPVSYGALLHAEGVTRRWRPGPVELDVFGGVDEDDRPVAVYRMSEARDPGQPPTVMFAGVVVGLPDRDTLTSDDLVRRIVQHLALREMVDDTSRRQRAFLARHSELLAAAAVEPPDHPYPRGTRIRVHDGDPSHAATGTVLAVVEGPTGPSYLWRPDVADLPGHPWQRQPTWALRTATHDVQATLESPDTGVGAPWAPLVQATGALVTTVDDPRFATGTVLRAVITPELDLLYDIQPHDATLPPVRLDAKAVIPTRAAAWQSIQELLAARATAGLPILDDEILVTRRERAVACVLDGKVRFFHQETRPGPDPTDGATPTAVPARLLRAAEGEVSAALRQTGDVVEVEDPVAGRLAVSAPAFQAALRRPQAELAAMVARRPWLPPCDGRPVFVLAAVAAQHAAGDLGLLPDLATSSPSPHSDGPSDLTPTPDALIARRPDDAASLDAPF